MTLFLQPAFCYLFFGPFFRVTNRPMFSKQEYWLQMKPLTAFMLPWIFSISKNFIRCVLKISCISDPNQPDFEVDLSVGLTKIKKI